MPTQAIDVHLHAKQSQAFTSKATEILYGGAAGGGKSFLFRASAIVWAAAIPGLQVYFFRRIRDDLIKNHMEGPNGFYSMLGDWVDAGHATIVENEVRFWNDSKIYMCHCKDAKDVHKYQGAEIHVLVIDELTHFTDDMYRYLRGRVRAPGLKVPKEYAGMFPRIMTGSNPGGPGHNFVKSGWVDAAPEGEIWRAPKTDGGMLRQFIRAKLEDNPSMNQDDPEYEDRLSGLGSPELVRAMRDGDWEVVQGAFFGEFTRDRHTVRPFSIPKHWLRFQSFDWGSARPFSVGWWAVSDGTLPAFPKNALIRYREWYGCEPGKDNVGLKLRSDEVARGILEREDDAERITYRVADPAIFNSDDGPSIAEKFATHKVVFRKGDNKRVAGWTQFRDRLIGEDDVPMLFVFDTCTNFIRTIPMMQHDEHKPEDCDTDLEDHIADEARYGMMSRPWIPAARNAAAKRSPSAIRGSLRIDDLTAEAEIDRNSVIG